MSSSDRQELQDTLPASDLPPGESGARDADRDSGAAIRAAPRGATSARDRYQLGVELGRGGMGRVVEAYDTQLGRTVALKEVLASIGEASERRFLREVQVTARLEHPSIVPLYDAGVGPDGRPFYVMRRVTGRPFDELIARARGLDERLTLLPALLAAIDAVAHAHRRRVLHRDLKPSNILVGELGETVVIDWGLAKVIDEPDEPAATDHSPGTRADLLQTQLGAVFGTPGFMAPEQARGEALGTDGDVYALGATLYQLLAGAPPHHAKSATEMISKTMRHEVKPVRDLAPGAPVELVAIVDKALAFSAADRYPDAGALAEDVRRFLAGQLVAAHHYTSRQKVRRFAQRFRGILLVSAIALATLVALAVVAVRRVVAERDTAATARATTESANAALRDRNDQLLIATARGALETNPTHAAALLKDLSPDSPRLAEGRAIAQAAVARGVAWSLPAMPDARSILMNPDGSRLVVQDRAGTLALFDLELRKRTAQFTAAPSAGLLWAGGDHLVVAGAGGAQVIDAVARTSTPLGAQLAVPLDGVGAATVPRALVRTPSGFALLDARAGTATPVPTPTDRAIAEVALSTDGATYALRGGGAITVHDATHRELARVITPATRLALDGAAGTFAFAVGTTVTECQVSGSLACEPVPLRLQPSAQIATLDYVDGVLQVLTVGFLVARRVDQGLVLMERERGDTLLRHTSSPVPMFRAAGGALAFPSDAGVIRVQLPIAITEVLVATDAAAHRLVAVSPSGILVGFELPVFEAQHVVGRVTDMLVLGEGTLLLSRVNASESTQFDLATNRTLPTELGLMATHVQQPANAHGYTLLRSMAASPNWQLLRARVGGATAEPVIVGRNPFGLLVGDTVVFGDAAAHTFAVMPVGEPARVVVTFEGFAQSVADLDATHAVLQSSLGELATVDLRTGAVERRGGRIPGVGLVAVAGTLYVLEPHRILRVDPTGAVPVATLERRIEGAIPCPGGLCVRVETEDIWHVELASGRAVRLASTGGGVALPTRDAHRYAALVGGGTARLFEVPSGVAWDRPVYDGGVQLAFALDGTALYQRLEGRIVRWPLPVAGPKLAEWLQAQTNAYVSQGDGMLAWRYDEPAP